MRNLLKPALLALPLAAAACAPSAEPGTVPAAARPQAPMSGIDFAQARCSKCHAVGRSQISPNPEAPPFEAIVATEGLTRATLRTFLRDSHNYPEKMNFEISPEQIDSLTDYMLTLRED